jgi:hypothetical protein
LGNKEFAIEYSCVLEDSRFSFTIFKKNLGAKIKNLILSTFVKIM